MLARELGSIDQPCVTVTGATRYRFEGPPAVSRVTLTSPNRGETRRTDDRGSVHGRSELRQRTTWVTRPASGVAQMLRWTVSGPATTHAGIRVKSSLVVMDESDADFTIAS